MEDALINPSEYEAFDNYVCLVTALSFTVDGLQDHVKNSLDSLRKEVNRKLLSMPKCNLNCSRKVGFDCLTCKLWKTELEKEKHRGYQNINWNKINSIDLHQSFEEIGKVYVKGLVVSRYGIFRDLGSILSLFENCRKFGIDKQIVRDVRDTRNEFFAHNYTRSLHTPDKIRCIEYLIKLLQVADIKQTQSAQLFLPKLLKLLHSNDVITEISNCKDDIEERITIQIEMKKMDSDEKEEELQLILSRLNNQTPVQAESTTPSPNHSRSRTRPKEWANAMPIIVVFIGCIYWLTRNDSEENITYGCFDMNMGKVPLGSQVIDDHRLYVGELYNQTVVEREWLYTLVETNLRKSRSVLLIADPGYGKTSVISQLVCANQSSLWLSIRHTLIFYHICRFDRSATQKSSEFIIKMANALGNRFDIIGNFYETNTFAREYLNEEYKCSKDPVSCFDYLIFHPTLLYHREFPNRTYTLIIDALDECQTTDEKYDISELLWMHIPKLPRNLKFLFILTSRNIEEIVSKYTRMDSFDVLNINEYRQEFDKDIFSYISKREMALSSNINKTEIVKVFNGNFLYAKYFLDYCLTQQNCELSDVPSSLQDYFELNLKRIFGKSAEQFEKVRPIFEVLAATSKPITEEMLLCISNSDHNMYSVIGKQLRHFVSIDNKNNIFFKHKAFTDYLTNYSNRHSPFYIDKYNGHERFANYLLQSLNTSRNVDVIELANHVALSRKPNFEAMFLLYASDMLYSTKMSKASYVHNVAKNFNCYDTMVLMIKLIGAGHIDDEDKDNETASFIAAESGNEYSLNALLEFGANIDFVKSCDTKEHIDEYDESCCGYSLAEVAAKRGQYKVVNLLLIRKPKLIDHKNLNSQNAMHVASENRNLKVVKEILQMNFTMADSYALYLAANNGFYDIVQVILKHGVVDACLPCNGTLYWRNDLSVDKSDNDPKIHWIWPNEIRLFKCETALHAAVDKGHRDIIKLLLNEKGNALQCRNAAGLTPLLQSVESNQFGIFIYLYENGANTTDRCLDPVYTIDRILTWHFSLPPPKIPYYRNGTSIIHLLARYDDTEITKYLLSKGVSNWLEYDDNGASTLHYALCYGSKKFISTIENMLNFSIALLEKTKYGHTPYQYAANCGSPLDTPMYFDGRQHPIKDDFDMCGRSLLQLAIMHTPPGDAMTSAKHFQLAISLKHDLFHLDNYKRNFLHNAALVGNSKILYEAKKHLSKSEMRKLLAQRSNESFIPLTLSVFRLGYQKYSNKHIENVITSFLFWGKSAFFSVDSLQLRFVLRCLNLSYLYSILTFDDIQHSVFRLLDTGKVLPLAYFRHFYKDEFTYITRAKIDLDRIDGLHDLFAREPSMVFIFLPPNITEYCSSHHKDRFLHRIVMNYRDKYWKSFENLSIWEKYFEDYKAHDLDMCYDNDGYNIFQRAVAGGNLYIISILLKKKASLSVSTKMNESIFTVAFRFFPFSESYEIPYEFSLGKPEDQLFQLDKRKFSNIKFTTRQHFTPAMDYLSSLDELINHINKSEKSLKLQKIVKKGDVCPLDQRKFGLLHLASAKGYLEFVKFVVELFGETILNCTDFYMISPKYLALLFNQGHVMSWISNIDQKTIYPSNRIQYILASLYVTNLNRRPSVHWTCFLTFPYKKATLIRRQFNQCTNQIFNNPDMCILCSEVLLRENYRHFKSMFNLILRYNYYMLNAKMSNILKMNRNMRRNVLSLYSLFRDIMYFGFGDRKMVYTMLSYDLKVRTNLTQGITYVKQKNNYRNYFRDITFNKDEYAPWIRAKMIHMMEEPVLCKNLRIHERKIRLWPVIRAKRNIMEWATHTYCNENRTCELRKYIYEYFNQTVLCKKNDFNSLFHLHLHPFSKISLSFSGK